MKIILCVDNKVIPGLHVALYSILDNISVVPSFSIFSDKLSGNDLELVKRTLNSLDKDYEIELCDIDSTSFSKFPKLNGSWATYYRLYAAESVTAERFLYVDADILCDIDLAPLNYLDMKGYPVAWVPEAPLNQAVDYKVGQELGEDKDQYYHNAGVMLVDSSKWKQQNISKKAMEYIAKKKPAFHDQSALNVICYKNALSLSNEYNCFSNDRKNWSRLIMPYGQIGRLVHFLDYPKPWGWGANVVHPMYSTWYSVLKKTALFDTFEREEKKLKGKDLLVQYKKIFKDKVLFYLFRKGYRNIKGTQ